MLLIVRLVASAIALVLVATYYLLASIPFSYYHFLQFAHFAWLPPFIALHPLIFAGAAAAALPWRDVPPPLTPWRRSTLLAAAVIAICMVAVLRVPALQSYELAAALSFAPLSILVAANVMHVAIGRAEWRSGEARSMAALVAGGALAGLIASAAFLAVNAPRAITDLRADEVAIAAGVSIAGHMAAFAAIAFAFAVAWRLTSRSRWPWFGGAGVLTVALAVLVFRSLLTALLLSPLRAAVLALTLGVALVTSAMALASQRLSRWRWPPWSAMAASVAVIVACAAIAPPMLQLADWGGSIQKMLVLIAWTACVCFVAVAPHGRARWPLAAACACLGWIAVASTLVAVRGDSSAAHDVASYLDVGLAVDRYATFDRSVGVLLDVFRPMATDTGFFRDVTQAGDATDNRSLAAVDFRLAAGRVPAAPDRPNIFVIVVDSLRPDYLSAYNHAASFTPNIGAFARDSLVMRRAFTPYAGTALSEPAIWAGGLVQRAMYIQPFAAVNNLQRLVGDAGYRSYVSIDEILSVILDSNAAVTRLDSQLSHPGRRDEMFKFDLCSTLTELQTHLDADPRDRPVFFYSQPQNLHIRVLAGDEYPRDERTRLGNVEFFQRAVTALNRIDGCFGSFIGYLKTHNLYDNSIIVITSDHGDAYNDAGRWGHAFYLAPETIRVPLVIHVPPRHLADRVIDVDQLALTTDITPTLYDLLGLAPAGQPGLAGRSLLPRTSGAPSPPRDHVLVQSSYSRVFGLLDGRARWLYVADANHYREEFYDFATADPFPRPVAPADRPKYRKWIIEHLEDLDQYYAPRRP